MDQPTPATDRVLADLEREHPACEVKCGWPDCDAPYESLLDLVADEFEESWP